ncbi:MAG: CheR family methyltransferase [Bacteroidota bacterium]
MGVTLGINDIKAVTSEMAGYDNMDYTGHSFSFMKRRLAFVFDKLKVRKLVTFSDQLKDDGFREEVKYFMAVKVTEMFRDPGFWRSVRHNIFPALGNNFTVWFPDTPSGEELFSFLILLKESNLSDSVKIVFQHSSEKICQDISNGIIDFKNSELNHSNYRRLEERDRFDNYFINDNDQPRLNKELLKNCSFRVFAPGKIGADEMFDLIIFRNSGINYSYSGYEELFTNIYGHLNSGGFLAVGLKETLPASLKDYLVMVDEKESIYRKPGVKNE